MKALYFSYRGYYETLFQILSKGNDKGSLSVEASLGWYSKDVGACKDVTNEVKKEMWEIVVGLQQKLNKKSSFKIEEETTKASEKRKNSETLSNNPRNISKNIVFSTQATINNIFKKGMREEACQALARFFYNNTIPFSMWKNEEFNVMFDLVSRHGLGFKLLSYHEIRVKYLKEEV